MKRAAIIVTDEEFLYWDGGPMAADVAGLARSSDLLLADLRYLIEAAPGPEADRVRKAIEAQVKP